MIEESLRNAVEKITVALQGRTEDTISGAMLGELIPKVTPELRVRDVMNIPAGPGALRKFIDLHLKHILTPSHKRGSDIIYLVTKNNVYESPDFWRTFVRSNSTRKIILRGAILSLEHMDGKNPEDGVLISNATNDELNQIRIDFMSSLGDAAQELPNIDVSYAEWSVALRKLGREHYRNWTEYRIRKIEELFENRLKSIGVESKMLGELRNQLRRSQLSAKEATSNIKISPNLTTKPSVDSKNQEIVSEDSSFRLAILDVIQRMPVLELRKLNLPAGELADALYRQYVK